MKVAKIENHHTEEELENLLKEYRTNSEVQNRILCILAVKRGHQITEIAKILNKSRVTCSKWVSAYNENGLEGIQSNRSNSGVRGKLKNEDLNMIKIELLKSDIKYTINQAKIKINKLFNTNFSYKYVWDITRNKLNLNYGKPKLNYKEHSEDYKIKLKESLEGFILNDIKLFFLDQSYFKNMPYLTRVLYDPDDKDNTLTRTGKRFGISVTGFMGVNGVSHADVYLRNNSFTTIYSLIQLRYLNTENEDIKEILMKILGDGRINRSYIKNELKKENKTPKQRVDKIKELLEKEDKPKISEIKKISSNKKITSARISTKQRTTIRDLLIENKVDTFLKDEKPLVIICDNAKIHTQKDVLRACEFLNIQLIFLPPYSPDLNPIEDLWRIIKKEVYYATYDSLVELIKIVLDEFDKNVDNKTLFENWLNDYM